MSPPPSKETLAQRMAALEKANGYRRWRTGKRAEWLAMWKTGGRVDALRQMAVIVEAPPKEAETWEVAAFLMAGPGIGAKKVKRLCVEQRTDMRRKLWELRPDARAGMARWLRAHAHTQALRDAAAAKEAAKR